MIPITIQAWIAAAITACGLGIYAMRAEFATITAVRIPAKYRQQRHHGQHRRRRGEPSTMQSRTVQALEQGALYAEPDWYQDLRATNFGADEFDSPPVGELGRYAHLRREELDSTHERFIRIVDAGLRPPSVWGTPVEVDEWDLAVTSS